MTDTHDFMALARKDAERAEPDAPRRCCRTCKWWTAHYVRAEYGVCHLVELLDDDDDYTRAYLSDHGPGDLSVELCAPTDWFCAGWEAHKETKDNER